MDTLRKQLLLWRQYIATFLTTQIANLSPSINSHSTALDIGIGDSIESIVPFFDKICTLDKCPEFKPDFVCNIETDKLDHLPEHDIVFLLEVLEHTERPWVVAEKVMELVKPMGYLFVTVPSFLFHHPHGHGHYGDYWRFLDGHIPFLFPGVTIKHKEICPHMAVESNVKATSLGMCYILQKGG